MKATDVQLKEWRATSYQYKLTVEEMVERAVGQARGTALPEDSFFGIAASPNTYKRAFKFLVTQQVPETNCGPRIHSAGVPPQAGAAPPNGALGGLGHCGILTG